MLIVYFKTCFRQVPRTLYFSIFFFIFKEILQHVEGTRKLASMFESALISEKETRKTKPDVKFSKLTSCFAYLHRDDSKLFGTCLVFPSLSFSPQQTNSEKSFHNNNISSSCIDTRFFTVDVGIRISFINKHKRSLEKTVTKCPH